LATAVKKQLVKKVAPALGKGLVKKNPGSLLGSLLKAKFHIKQPKSFLDMMYLHGGGKEHLDTAVKRAWSNSIWNKNSFFQK
jgi:hypothetical protein